MPSLLPDIFGQMSGKSDKDLADYEADIMEIAPLFDENGNLNDDGIGDADIEMQPLSDLGGKPSTDNIGKSSSANNT